MMDVARIFDGLPEWSGKLDDGQEALLERLMAATSTTGFAGIPADEVRLIQERMLKSMDESSRRVEMRRATHHLKPVESEIGFV
jgi:hypothetical protein